MAGQIAEFWPRMRDDLAQRLPCESDSEWKAMILRLYDKALLQRSVDRVDLEAGAIVNVARCETQEL